MNYTKKAELHCHSHQKDIKVLSYPPIYDAIQSIEEIVDTAYKKGIRILAITDHNKMSAIPKAQKYIEDNNLDILLIPASEISTKDGHILAYNIKTPIPRGLPAEIAIQKVHEQGGIAVIAHPYSLIYGVKNKTYTLPVDGIEGYNAGFLKFQNKKAQKVAQERNLPCIAGSDSHTPGSIAFGVTVFPEDTNTVEKFINYLKNKQFRVEFKKANMLEFAIAYSLGCLKIALGKKD